MNGCIIPGTNIAVDFWKVQQHPRIQLFFLTHLHGDHVVGLTSSWRRPIHCSPNTAHLLTQRYGLHPSLIRSLEVGQAHLIPYCQGHYCHRNYATVHEDAFQQSTASEQRSSSQQGKSLDRNMDHQHDKALQQTETLGKAHDMDQTVEQYQRSKGKHPCCIYITVTVIDANHCAGAVMFLFEGPFGKILHTGDFRYTESMFEKDSPLSKQIGTIDVVYLDNTYCSPKCVFPSRLEAVKEIVEIVKCHSNHDILFGVRNLGKEEMLAAVALVLGEWINVSPNMMAIATVLGLPNVFVTGLPDTRLRVVPFHSVSSIFIRQLNSMKPTIIILPTALYRGISGKPYANQPKVFVVPYSDHSSYLELHEFVCRLRPACVKPIVKGKVRGPFGTDISSREDMSCFQKYLTEPCHPPFSAVVSGKGDCCTSSQGQNLSVCGFAHLFTDFRVPFPTKRKSLRRPARKAYPKGVNFDDAEEEVLSGKRRKRENDSADGTKHISTALQASIIPHRQSTGTSLQNCMSQAHELTFAKHLQTSDDNTGKNSCELDSQGSIVLLESDINSVPLDCVPLQSRTSRDRCVMGVGKSYTAPHWCATGSKSHCLGVTATGCSPPSPNYTPLQSRPHFQKILDNCGLAGIKTLAALQPKCNFGMKTDSVLPHFSTPGSSRPPLSVPVQTLQSAGDPDHPVMEQEIAPTQSELRMKTGCVDIAHQPMSSPESSCSDNYVSTRRRMLEKPCSWRDGVKKSEMASFLNASGMTADCVAVVPTGCSLKISQPSSETRTPGEQKCVLRERLKESDSFPQKSILSRKINSVDCECLHLSSSVWENLTHKVQSAQCLRKNITQEEQSTMHIRENTSESSALQVRENTAQSSELQVRENTAQHSELQIKENTAQHSALKVGKNTAQELQAIPQATGKNTSSWQFLQTSTKAKECIAEEVQTNHLASTENTSQKIFQAVIKDSALKSAFKTQSAHEERCPHTVQSQSIRGKSPLTEFNSFFREKSPPTEKHSVHRERDALLRMCSHHGVQPAPFDAHSASSRGQASEPRDPVRATLEAFLLHTYLGQSVSGRQQRAKLMDTYNRLFGPESCSSE